MSFPSGVRPDRPKVFHYFQHSGLPLYDNIILLIVDCHAATAVRGGGKIPVSPPHPAPCSMSSPGFSLRDTEGGQVFPSHHPSVRLSCRTTNTGSLCCKTIEVCVPNQVKPPFSRQYNVSGQSVSIVCYAGNFSTVTLTLTWTVMSLSPMFAMFDFVLWSNGMV